MTNKILRNEVEITGVFLKKAKQYAFGVILEEEPRVAFFPHWVVKAANLVEGDVGAVVDCLFVNQTGALDPLVLMVLDDDELTLKPSEIVGEYEGIPGQKSFNAKVTNLNRN